MSFFSKLFSKTGNPSEKPLELRAIGVIYGLLCGAAIFAKSIVEEIEKDTRLSQQQKDEIEFIVSYVLLFKAQEYFYENVIADRREAREFEDHLFAAFQQAYKIDPKPYVLDYAIYVRERSPSDDLQYPGRKICEVIDLKSAILLIEIATIMAPCIAALYGACDQAWNSDEDSLRSIKADFDKRCSKQN